METNHLYSFGPFRIDSAKRLLQRDQETIPLPTKPFDVLLFLVRNRDRLVEKDELMAVLWPDTTVEENNLSQSISAIRKALGDSPHQQQYIETVPGWGYRFAAPVYCVSDEKPTPPLARVPGIDQRLTVRRAVVGLAATLMLIAGGLLYVAARRGTKPSKPAGPYQVVSRTSIAVLGFDNLSGDKKDEWLATALAEMLSTELAGGGTLRIVSGEDIARVKIEMPRNTTKNLTTERLQELNRRLGSDLLIFGSYVAIGDRTRKQIRFDVRLENAKTGEMITEIAETGASTDLFDLVSRAGTRLRDKLGVSGSSPNDTVVLRASSSANTRAEETYSEGLASLRVFDAVHARDQLLQSVLFDPTYPLSHSALAEAWSSLGYDSKAVEEARKAFQLSRGLSPEERLMVEGRYRVAARDWRKASEVYNNLTTMFPDNPDYGLRLAAVQTAGSNPEAALVTLSRLRLLPPPLGKDPRISLESSNAWHALGNFKQMEASLEDATGNAQAAGQRLLLARGRSQQCYAWRFLGEQQKAISACEEAQQIYLSAGDRGGQAETLRLLGDAVSESDVNAAMRFYEHALAIQNQIGHLWGQATVLNQMAILSSNRGDHAGAKNSFEKVLRICDRLDNRVSGTGMMLNIASELASQGKLREARAMYEKALGAATHLGNKDIQGKVANNIAMLDELSGDLDAAQRNFEQARGLLEAVQDRNELTVSITGMGEVAMSRGDFDSAQQFFESALEIRRSGQQKIPAAESQFDLLTLSVERGDSSTKVENALRDLISLFQDEKSTNNEVIATSLLARILLAQGRFEEALATAEKALSASAKANPNFRLSAKVTATPIRVAAGHSTVAQATENLNRAISEARRFGYIATALEAMVDLGELEMRSGAVALGRSQLQVVRKEASRRGFRVLAQRAASKSA